MKILHYSTAASPVGPLDIVMSDSGLAQLEFHHKGKIPARDDAGTRWVHDHSLTKAARAELEEYFCGKRRSFTIALDLQGTAFQMRCWQELLKIPYGQTRCYADIARAIGSPRAFRAVGMANHDNPVAIVVPCHRVLASNGGLCGYGGGLDIKQKLLELEGVLTPTNCHLKTPPLSWSCE